MILSRSAIVVLFLSEFHSEITIAARHRRRSIPPEEAAIFDGLESLSTLPDDPLGLSCVLTPTRQLSLELLSCGSMCHFLPSTVTNPHKFVAPFGDEVNSHNQLRCDHLEPLIFQTPGKSHERNQKAQVFKQYLCNYPLSRHEHFLGDTWNPGNPTPTIVNQNLASEIRGWKASTPLDARVGYVLHPFQRTGVNGSGSTGEAHATSQSHFNWKQDPRPQKQHSRTVKSTRPLSCAHKCKISKRFMRSAHSVEQDPLPVKMIEPMPLERQMKFRKNYKADNLSFQVAKKDFNQEYQKLIQNEEQHQESDTLVNPVPDAEPDKIHEQYKQNEEQFLQGLLSVDPKIRVVGLTNYLKMVLPNFSFTSINSLEELVDCIKKELVSYPATKIPSCWLWGSVKRRDVGISGGLLSVIPFQRYRTSHRPYELRPSKNVGRRIKNKFFSEVSVQAGLRRLKKLGIIHDVEVFFENLKDKVQARAWEARIMQPVTIMQTITTKQFIHLIQEFRRATILMLYQVDMLYRLTTPSAYDLDLRIHDALKELLENLKEFWLTFALFSNQSELKEEEIPTNCFKSLDFLKEMNKKIRRCGDFPTGMRLSKTILVRWCLKTDPYFFGLFKFGVKGANSCEFFGFLEDCAIADLISMIKLM